MSNSDAKAFRAFLLDLGNPENVSRAGGKTSFKASEAIAKLPFRDNKYREILAAAEALGLGLVSRVDQNCPKLNIPTLQEIEEIHDVRLLLETEICRRVALYSARGILNRDNVLKVLLPLHDRMEALERRLSELSDEVQRLCVAEKLWDLDGLFHETLAQLAGWPLFGLAVRIIRDRLRFVSTPEAQIISRAAAIIREHKSIIDAVTNRRYEKEAVEMAVDEHLLNTIQFLENEENRRNKKACQTAAR